MVLLTMLAISTLVHWDIGGEPAHVLFHQKELVGVRHRYLIWGIALAASLSVVCYRLWGYWCSRSTSVLLIAVALRCRLLPSSALLDRTGPSAAASTSGLLTRQRRLRWYADRAICL